MNINYSIIIPHKNRFHLLQKCIDSIPIRNDLELIIVDDNSDFIEKENFPGSNRENTTIIYNKKSGGGGYARNIGLQKAKGKWIVFADSDDYFLPAFEIVLEKYKYYPQDIIWFKAESIDIETGKQSFRAKGLNSYIDLAIQNNNYNHLKFEVAYPVAKFIKQSLINTNKVKFEEVPNGNDVYFSMKTGELAKNTLAVDKKIYMITTRQEHKIDKNAVTIYINIYNSFYRKAKYLKSKNLIKYVKPNLTAYWVRIYNVNKKEACLRFFKTTKMVGVLYMLKRIHKPLFYRSLEDLKICFPKLWQILKQIKKTLSC